MSWILQAKILSFPLGEYAKVNGCEISPRAISAVKLLLISLADFYNDETHQCNPSIATLAKCIEKSSSQTTVHMKTLKNLGLVSATKNAKGGRYTPNYAINIPSPPEDAIAGSPSDAIPLRVSHPLDRIEPSYQQDSAPLVDKIRILIDPLDKTLIRELVKENNSVQKLEKLVSLGKKYKVILPTNAPLYELQDHLLKMANY